MRSSRDVQQERIDRFTGHAHDRYADLNSAMERAAERARAQAENPEALGVPQALGLAEAAVDDWDSAISEVERVHKEAGRTVSIRKAKKGRASIPKGLPDHLAQKLHTAAGQRDALP